MSSSHPSVRTPAPALPAKGPALKGGRAADPSHSSRGPHITGLDGLRGIAVSLVVVFHTFPQILPGGFLGVDVFFVISGYLITTLLLRERARNGRIALIAFWKRRGRRLLPALLLVILVTAATASVLRGDPLLHLGRQLLTTLTFTYNWGAIVGGSSYFDATAPELFRNFWSLAVEEQFYLVWPLIFLILAPFGRRVIAVVAGALAGTSLLLMALLAPASGEDPSRVYFGTDTHAFPLLLGCVLAALLFEVEVSPRWKRRLVALGVGGLVFLGILARTLHELSRVTYPVGLLVVVLATVAVVIAGSLVPRFGKVLDSAPLRWVGERSYGIYLWHWPLWVLCGALIGYAQPVTRGVVTIALTLLFAQLSYTAVERPVRAMGFRGTARAIWSSLRGRYGQGARVTASVATALVAVLTGTLIAGALTAPTQSEAEQLINRGKAAVTPAPSTDDADEPSPPIREPEPPSEPKESEPGPLLRPDGEPDPPRELPAPTAEALAAVTLPPGDQISAVGDSVMLASVPELQARFPGIAIDAAVSRSFDEGLRIAEAQQSEGTLRHYVILGVATNGPVPAESAPRVQALAQHHEVILVNAYGDRTWIGPGNEELGRFVSALGHSAVIADWNRAASSDPTMLAPDQIHPNPPGQAAYAVAVETALRTLRYYHPPEQAPDASATAASR